MGYPKDNRYVEVANTPVPITVANHDGEKFFIYSPKLLTHSVL